MLKNTNNYTVFFLFNRSCSLWRGVGGWNFLINQWGAAKKVGNHWVKWYLFNVFFCFVKVKCLFYVYILKNSNLCSYYKSIVVTVCACCLLPSRYKCDLQSKVLWTPSSQWASGTHRGFPVDETNSLKHRKLQEINPQQIIRNIKFLTVPACRSAFFPAGEFCPTVKHLCLSLAWKVCHKYS